MGADESDHSCVESAADSSEDSRGGECELFAESDAHTYRIRQIFARPDAQQRATHTRAPNRVRRVDAHEQDGEDQVEHRNRRFEVDESSAFGELHVVDAGMCVGDGLPTADDEEDDEADGHCEDGEVLILRAQGDQPAEVADDRSSDDGCDECGPEAPIVIGGEQPDSVGADAEEPALGEVQLSREAEDDVEAVDSDRRAHADGDYSHRVVLLRKRQGRQAEQDDDGDGADDPRILH